jgi:formate hydrogenlyase subunit 3/multisubunit Na+/H+ antiporter MnhD subunit
MPILVPLIAGVLALLVSRLRNEFSFIGVVVNLYYAVRIFLSSRSGVLSHDYVSLGAVNVGFRADGLSAFVLLAAAFLGLVVVVFSFRYMRSTPGTGPYYLFVLLTLACANGVFLAGDLVVVLFFWGVLAAVLYGMLFLSPKDASPVAMKGLVIAAGADLLMMTGIGLLLFGAGSSEIAPALRIPLTTPLAIAAFALIAAGALAKAGSMPFHTWIPSAAETAPPTFLGFVPGAIDKLLGIYLLARLSCYIFDIGSSMAVRNVLMAVGSVTILGAVLMALVQKETMKLLSFHAVSQVGYMVLGIGTGNPVGIAGGLFHMVNHALYKSTLFYAAGSVELRTRETRLDRLGGLAGRMPLTLFSFLIAALAISGVPPLNGFVSKWMVYQGVLQLGAERNPLWPMFLIAALLGSVFTLASFLKVLHSLFFGQTPESCARVREVGVAMWLPTMLQALACIAFGVAASAIPIRLLILPSLPPDILDITRAPWNPTGFYQATTTTGLILLGIALGLGIYLLGRPFKTSRAPAFVGGEDMPEEEARITGTEFYGPVKTLRYLKDMFASAESGALDFYNLGMNAARGIAEFVFHYVDRTVDRFYSVASDLIVMFGRGFRSFASWFFLILLLPILVFAASGNLVAVQYMAIALTIVSALITLVETKFRRFLLLVSLAQLGLIILAFSRGGSSGVLAGLYQIYNSVTAYLCVYCAYRLLIRTRPGDEIFAYRGASEGMPVAAAAFVIGGLCLSGMPPSGNFFSKYLLASVYPDNMTYTMIIIFVALLMLATILRVISRVFFGPPNAEYHEAKGRLYYVTLGLTILAVFNGLLAKPLIDLMALVFGVSVR